jgi:hypothetical protein
MPSESHLKKFNAVFKALSKFADLVAELHELMEDCKCKDTECDCSAECECKDAECECKTDMSIVQKLDVAKQGLTQYVLYYDHPNLDAAHEEALGFNKAVLALVMARLN